MLNENIKELRKANNLTQKEFAEKLNVVRQTVSKWEKGISVPDADMLILISQKFNVSVNSLLDIPEKESSEEYDELLQELSAVNEKYATAREKSRKRIRALSLSGITATLVYFIYLIVMEVNMISLATNYGIIGGADGPTAIFVSSTADRPIKLIIVFAVLLLSIIGIIKSRKK